MANRFFARLLGRHAPCATEVSEALAALQEIAHAQPTLQSAALVLGDLLPVVFAGSNDEPTLALTPEAARTKLVEGIPLLRGESLTLDGKACQRRWRAACDALHPHVGGAAQSLRRAGLDPGELLREVLAGPAPGVHARVEAFGLDAALVATVLRLTSFAFLSRLAATLAPLRADSTWTHGYCPTCGSWPLLGEFRGLDQVRVLRCGWCATGWEFPRLRCVFCGQRDHTSLGYLHVEGQQDRQRAATCESCRGYIKMVATLAPLSGPLLLVTDLATLHLDLAAANRDYFVP